MIELYTAPTPNGFKVSIALEELGLDYETRVVDLGAGEQKSPEFLRICPNGRIPAIVDRDRDDFPVFESGAILVYLAEKTGKLLPGDWKGRSRAMQWLMFQMGGVGPMQGQANVFGRYFGHAIPEAISRYRNETRRLYEVLNDRLAASEYLAGPYSIADIATYPWVASHRWSGIEMTGLMHLKTWLHRVGQRPAVQRGMKVPPRTDAQTAQKAAQSMVAR